MSLVKVPTFDPKFQTWIARNKQKSKSFVSLPKLFFERRMWLRVKTEEVLGWDKLGPFPTLYRWLVASLSVSNSPVLSSLAL